VAIGGAIAAAADPADAARWFLEAVTLPTDRPESPAER
jgi:hypothetical protein